MATQTTRQSAFLKYEAPMGYSRETVTIASGRSLVAGTVLGIVTASGKYVGFDQDATNGSEDAVAVLLDAVDATSADATGVAIVRHAIVVPTNLTYVNSPDAGEKTAALAALKALGITNRTAV